jgi:hypothetical protein
MAKILFSAVVGDARKKAGGVVFSKSRFGSYIRKKTSPVQPRTTSQRGVRANFTANSKAWSGTLTSSQRLAYITLANANPVKDRFGNTQTLTGHQIFNKLNRNLHTIGQPLLTTAPTSLSVSDLGGLALQINGSGYSVGSGVATVKITGAGTGLTVKIDGVNSNTGIYPLDPTPTAGGTGYATGDTFTITGTPGGAIGYVVAQAAGVVSKVALVPQIAVSTTNPPASGEYLVVNATATENAGRSFVGKKLRIIDTEIGTVTQPINETAKYAAKFGALVNGNNATFGVYNIQSATGAAGKPYTAIANF